MGDDFAFFDIILLAMVAAILIYRLRNVLGRRTGHEKRHRDIFQPGTGEQGWGDERGEKIIPLPDRTATPGAPDQSQEPAPVGEAAPSLAAGLDRIATADRTFNDKAFLAGAREAFTRIVETYAKGDTGTLRLLLSRRVYDDFAAAIERRQRARETLETDLVSIKSADLLEAYMEGRTAFITVKFISQQVNVTRDEDRRIVEGNREQVIEVTDIWTFARNTRSRDPNWTLVATGSPN
jgi:predicted lipid-binding transport protein (Tim44 family)